MGRFDWFANLQCGENPRLLLTDGREPSDGLGLVDDDEVVLNTIEQRKHPRGRELAVGGLQNLDCHRVSGTNRARARSTRLELS